MGRFSGPFSTIHVFIGALLFVLFASLTSIMSGCGSSSVTGSAATAAVTQCILPAYQINSLQGHWSSLPIKVSLHAGDFNATEIQAIQAAATTWNTFFGTSKGAQVL